MRTNETFGISTGVASLFVASFFLGGCATTDEAESRAFTRPSQSASYTTSEPVSRAQSDELSKAMIAFGKEGRFITSTPGIHDIKLSPHVQVLPTDLTLAAPTPDQTKRHYIVMVRTNQSSEMETTRLYVNGTLRFTATRANGAIVDGPYGTSVASMAFWENPDAIQDGQVEVVASQGVPTLVPLFSK